MLSSVLPWEWILEVVLDLKEFSLPCLKELISYIPHIEDPRCGKLLQKVALRYLEEIVLTRKVDPLAIILIKYILNAQGGSNLRRIHSLKESVENDLILRVETEVVLATIRHQFRNGGRNWEAFEDAVEEVFPESTRETCKAERRKELISILSVDEHQDDLFEEVVRKYPVEDLLKDLLLFIESKKHMLKTKFLDQLAKDVHSGSYIPVSASRPSKKGFSTRMHTSRNSYGNPEVPETFLPRDKAVLPYSLQTEPSLPNILLGEPIERSTKAIKELLAHVHIKKSCPSSPVSLVDGGQTAKLEVEELCDRNLAGKKATGLDKVSVQDDLRVDMSPCIMEVEKVVWELTSQMNEFVDNMENFAADIHKVAVNSTEQPYPLVNTVVAQEEQRVDSVSFLANFRLAVKRPAADRLPESTKKCKRSCVNDRPGRGTDIDEGSPAKAGLNVRNADSTGRSMRKDDLNTEMDCSVPGDVQRLPIETSLYRRFKAFLRQSTQEQLVPRPSKSTVPVLRRVSRGNDTVCAICRRGGVLLSCHGCSVVLHERCLEDLDMGRAVSDPYWFCPSCVEQLTLEVLERVKGEADTARQKAAAFVLARSKRSTESVDGRDQMTTGAVLEPEEITNWKDGKEQAPGLNRGPKSSSLDGKQASQAPEMKDLEGCSSRPTYKLGGNRYFLRPRVLSNTRKDINFIFDEVEDLPRSIPNTTTGVDGAEPVPSPSSTVAASNPSKPISKMVTPETVQSAPAMEEILETSIPSRECVENNVHTNSPIEAKETATAASSATEQNVHGGGDLSPAKDPQVNISKVGVDEGDGHDGDLEEDINRHQDDAECSKDDQTSHRPSTVDERTPPRRGRYRGRWKIPGIRRRHLPWSESEIVVLREGVKKFSSSGWGFQWKNILEFGYGKFDPSRTTVDLKDKWRNLNKSQHTSYSSDVSS